MAREDLMSQESHLCLHVVLREQHERNGPTATLALASTAAEGCEGRVAGVRGARSDAGRTAGSALDAQLMPKR